MYRLDVRALSYTAGSTQILHGISLSLKAGELVAILGPSGSGKSTLLTAMMGFRPGDGRVSLCGHDLYGQFEQHKHLIGFVPQDDILHRGLSVERTLHYAALLRLPVDMPSSLREATVRSVMEQVELTERKNVKVRRLSGGQRKRVSIAVELLAKPPLLFLDEPTSGLDPALEEKTMDLFRSLTTPDRLTVVTTHVMASLDVVDFALIVAKGRLVFAGPPLEAMDFFEARDLGDVYRVLGKSDPSDWSRRFSGTEWFREYIGDRLASPPPPLPSSGGRPEPGATPAGTPAATQEAAAKPAPPSPEEELARLKAKRRSSES